MSYESSSAPLPDEVTTYRDSRISLTDTADEYYQQSLSFQDRGLYDDAERGFSASLRAAEEVGDLPRMATSLERLAEIAQERGQGDQAGELNEISAAAYERAGDIARNRHDQAQLLYRRSGKIYERLEDRLGQARILEKLADLAIEADDTEEVRRLLQHRAFIFYEVARGFQYRGEYDDAEVGFWTSYWTSEALKDLSAMATSLERLAEIAQERGQGDQAVKLYGMSAAAYKQGGDIMRDRGDHDKAQLLYDQSVKIRSKIEAVES
jgi:tetratricopeptide (TPR) repeat protein